MTRVWRAVQISGFGGHILPGTVPVALKDVWLDNDVRTEGWIQQEIFSAVDSEHRKHEEKLESRLDLVKSWDWPGRGSNVFDIICNGEYRKYFLEIDFDGQGISTKAKPPDAQPTLGLFTRDKKKKSLESRSQQISSSDRRRSTGSSTYPSYLESEVVIDEEAYRQRRYLPKRRYLLIFNDICIALHDMTDLRASFLVLHDASIALAIMFVANWVHRDVSSGNILSLGEGKDVQGKLSDLEYAKPFMADSPHSADPKTGTPFFMAYELLSRLLVYHPRPAVPVRDNKKLLAMTRLSLSSPPPELTVEVSTLITLKRGVKRPIIYNFEHDLESLWWIALWILLARIAHEPSQEYAMTFYINRLGCSDERRSVFLEDGHLANKLEEKIPSTLHPLIHVLDACRSSLTESYMSREEQNKLADPQTYSELYPAMRHDLMTCSLYISLMKNPPSLVSLHPRRYQPTTETSGATEGGTPSTTAISLGKRPYSTDAGEINAGEPSSKAARGDNEQEPNDPDLRPGRRLFP